MTKRCPSCSQTKPIDDFALNRQRPDGHQSMCKMCKRSLDKAYYLRPEKKKQIRDRAAATRTMVLNWLAAYLSAHPCVDCCENDIIVLEFDHVRGVKTCAVSAMLSQNVCLQRIQGEVEKCDVRCANCHRRKTAKDHRSWRHTGAGIGSPARL